MDLKDLFYKTRSCRRFDENQQVSMETLENLVELARLSPTGGNRQPLKFLIYNKPEDSEKIFPYLSWAAYYPEWQGPDRGERPSAYILILGDRDLADNFGVDHGIAAHSIMLGATNEDLGGCIIASLKRDELCSELKIPDRFEILLVLAIGKPMEKSVLEELTGDDVRYWRDKDGHHHVPKRNLEDLILKL